MRKRIFLLLGFAFFALCHQAHAQRRLARIPIGTTKAGVLKMTASTHYAGSDGVYTYLIDADWVSAVAMIDDKVVAAGMYLDVFNTCNPRALPTNADGKSKLDTSGQSGLRIVSITPVEVTEGCSTSITVRIAYQLAGSRDALVALRVNAESPQSFLSVAQQAIHPGSGEIEITGHIAPKIHGPLLPVTANVVLIIADAGGAKCISHSNRDITITPGP